MLDLFNLNTGSRKIPRITNFIWFCSRNLGWPNIIIFSTLLRLLVNSSSDRTALGRFVSDISLAFLLKWVPRTELLVLARVISAILLFKHLFTTFSSSCNQLIKLWCWEVRYFHFTWLSNCELLWSLQSFPLKPFGRRSSFSLSVFINYLIINCL